MNKNKVIELLNLIKNENFYKELIYLTNNEKLTENDIDYTKILTLTEEEIDNILNTIDTRTKAYIFYIHIIDKKYKENVKEKLLEYVNDRRMPYFLINYLRDITMTPNLRLNMEKELKMIEKVLDNSAFRIDIKYVIDNKKTELKDLPRILEAITFAENASNKQKIINMALKESIMKHKEAVRILEAISKSKEIDNSTIVYELLLNKDVLKNIDNLCYIIEQMLKTTPEKAKLSKEALENENIQNLCSPRNIIESITEATNTKTAKIAIKIAENEKLQTKDNFYEYIKEIAKAKGEFQAINGKFLLEYLLENDKIEDFKTLQLLRGITRAQEKEISDNALKAAENTKLQKHREYEQIVYNLGTYSKNIDSSNFGLKIIETPELQENKKLFKIVNYIISDFNDKENTEKAFNLSQNKNMQTKPYLDFIIETIIRTKDKEKVNLAYKYLADENNKELKYLPNIACLISSANTQEKAKIIYDLANNPEVINLEEEGLAIMKEVHKAETKEEIDYILNQKYNINNLGNLIRLTKIFESDSSAIIKELENLEENDISKDTIVRRKLRK